ncbi:MAG: glycosyl transferase family 1 [Hyphomicrobiales bacterium]|nr:glycosyl transferase family 1 [Hyphomicrobiales bacterium]
MARAVFAIPGDLASLTGGYRYDREVMARLPGLGVAVEHLQLPGSFPSPGPQDLAVTERLLASVPRDAVLFIDGLAFGACPAALVDVIAAPIVAMVHHPLALETGLADPSRRALATSERNALARASHVVVPSPATRDVLATDYSVPLGKITVALPGTDRAPQARSSGASSLALLAVGSVVPRKGYDVLVEALTRLGTEYWSLTIAGSLARAPDHVAALEAQIAACGLASRIKLTGEIDAAALDALYAGADVFILSSHYEGYGMVLAEAMVRGLPIVVTTGGAADDTVPDAAALKIPPGDVLGLRSALLRMVQDAPLRKSLAEASFTAGQALPTWEDTAGIVAAVLSSVAEGKWS